MITIISGTNRKEAKTDVFAKYYLDILKHKTNERIQYISLADIQHLLLHDDMYNPNSMTTSLQQLQEDKIIPTQKFIFLIPEYNGSYPGILKLFIDAISIHKYKENFMGKKASLVGISSGRAGCSRGMDHLSAVLNHVGITVMPQRLPISSIGDILSKTDEINEQTKTLIQQHIDTLLDF